MGSNDCQFSLSDSKTCKDGNMPPHFTALQASDKSGRLLCTFLTCFLFARCIAEEPAPPGIGDRVRGWTLGFVTDHNFIP